MKSSEIFKRRLVEFNRRMKDVAITVSLDELDRIRKKLESDKSIEFLDLFGSGVRVDLKKLKIHALTKAMEYISKTSRL